MYPSHDSGLDTLHVSCNEQIKIISQEKGYKKKCSTSLFKRHWHTRCFLKNNDISHWTKVIQSFWPGSRTRHDAKCVHSTHWSWRRVQYTYYALVCTETETNCISDVMDNVTMTNNHSVTYSQEFYWLWVARIKVHSYRVLIPAMQCQSR